MLEILFKKDGKTTNSDFRRNFYQFKYSIGKTLPTRSPCHYVCEERQRKITIQINEIDINANSVVLSETKSVFQIHCLSEDFEARAVIYTNEFVEKLGLKLNKLKVFKHFKTHINKTAHLPIVLAFGKQQYWIHSPKIINASIASFVSLILLVIRQYTLKRPYISFKIFRKNNVIHGLIMLLMTGIFLSTGSIQNIFTIGILGYDPVLNSKLNLLMIPGIVAAGVYMAFWFKQGRGLKMFIFLGFAAMQAYTVIMYFSMGLEFNFENWILPMLLKGFGMGALFIAVWYYALDKLEMTEMMAATGLVLVWRTFFSVGIFSALFSWLQYQFQIEAVGNLAIYMDGNSYTLNQVMGNMKAIQFNAILAANKRLLGYVCIAGVGILMYVLSYHFGVDHHKIYRGYKVNSERRKHKARLEKSVIQEIEDAAGAVL